MRRLSVYCLLASLACAAIAGCGKDSAATEPPSAEQLEEKLKQVHEEERNHQQQLRAQGGAPSQSP